MSRADGWMPLWIGDYLADTMHLTGPEHGAYLLLLMHSWRNGPLPDDDRQLAAIARTDRAAWKDIGPTIRTFFQATPAGLVQKRLEAERANAASNAERRTEAARTAATKRWHGNANAMPDACATHAPSNARRMPDAMRGECPTPSPSSPNGEERPPTPSPDGDGGSDRPSDWNGQWRGLRANGSNPRAQAAKARAAAPPPPEPDHPLWPRFRGKVSEGDFRQWVQPLAVVDGLEGRRVLVASSPFRADYVRAKFSHLLDGYDVRARPEAAHG